jgi:hypothetical protein
MEEEIFLFTATVFVSVMMYLAFYNSSNDIKAAAAAVEN